MVIGIRVGIRVGVRVKVEVKVEVGVKGCTSAFCLGAKILEAS